MNCIFYKTENNREILILSNSVNAQIKDFYIKDRGAVCVKITDTLKSKDVPSVIDDLITIIKENNCKVCLCLNSEWYKRLLTKSVGKVTGYKGIPMESKLGIPLFLGSSITNVVFNPTVEAPVAKKVFDNIVSYLNGTYAFIEPLRAYTVFSDAKSLRSYLNTLKVTRLTCDIETHSLDYIDANFATISFGIDEHTGFGIWMLDDKENIKEVLRELFERDITFIYHNVLFDVYVLVYELYMSSISDFKGMYKGINVMLKNFEDTLQIAYLATNNSSRNELGLKELSQEYMGAYAEEDINDITKIPKNELLKYNVRDCIATWYVYNKYYPMMIKDHQEKVYDLYKAFTKELMIMQLVGLYLNPNKVQELQEKLNKDKQEAIDTLNSSSIMKSFNNKLKEKWVEEKNKKLKKKKVTIADCNIEFNPGSDKQISQLLFEYLKLPVLKTTEKGENATGRDVLNKLIAETDNEEIKSIISSLIQYSTAEKIANTYIPVFTKHGNHISGKYRLGGTVSGRISSKEP